MPRPKKLPEVSPAASNTPGVKRKPGRPAKPTLASTLRGRASFHRNMAEAYQHLANVEEGRK